VNFEFWLLVLKTYRKLKQLWLLIWVTFRMRTWKHIDLPFCNQWQTIVPQK